MFDDGDESLPDQIGAASARSDPGELVPNAQTQEMRNLLGTRKQLVRGQASHVKSVQKALEDANIKLDSVLTDVMGKSGRAR